MLRQTWRECGPDASSACRLEALQAQHQPAAAAMGAAATSFGTSAHACGADQLQPAARSANGGVATRASPHGASQSSVAAVKNTACLGRGEAQHTANAHAHADVGKEDGYGEAPAPPAVSERTEASAWDAHTDAWASQPGEDVNRSHEASPAPYAHGADADAAVRAQQGKLDVHKHAGGAARSDSHSVPGAAADTHVSYDSFGSDEGAWGDVQQLGSAVTSVVQQVTTAVTTTAAELSQAVQVPIAEDLAGPSDQNIAEPGGANIAAESVGAVPEPPQLQDTPAALPPADEGAAAHAAAAGLSGAKPVSGASHTPSAVGHSPGSSIHAHGDDAHAPDSALTQYRSAGDLTLENNAEALPSQAAAALDSALEDPAAVPGINAAQSNACAGASAPDQAAAVASTALDTAHVGHTDMAAGVNDEAVRSQDLSSSSSVKDVCGAEGSVKNGNGNATASDVPDESVSDDGGDDVDVDVGDGGDDDDDDLDADWGERD